MSIENALKIQQLLARVAALEAAQAEHERTLPQRLDAVVAACIERYMAPYAGLPAKVEDLYALRAAIVSDVRALVGNPQKPIDARKVSMPQSLRKLGIKSIAELEGKGKGGEDESTGAAGV